MRDFGRSLTAAQWARYCGRDMCAESIDKFVRTAAMPGITSEEANPAARGPSEAIFITRKSSQKHSNNQQQQQSSQAKSLPSKLTSSMLQGLLKRSTVASEAAAQSQKTEGDSVAAGDQTGGLSDGEDEEAALYRRRANTGDNSERKSWFSRTFKRAFRGAAALDKKNKGGKRGWKSFSGHNSKRSASGREPDLRLGSLRKIGGKKYEGSHGTFIIPHLQITKEDST